VTNGFCRLSLVFARIYLEAWGAELPPRSHMSGLLVITSTKEMFFERKGNFGTLNDIHTLIL
jgi:hypothetical protein